MLFELRKLAAQNIFKINEIQLKISSEQQVKELIEFFKEHSFESPIIELDFEQSLDLKARSILAIQLMQIIKHVNGLNVFILRKSVKDYVFEELFKLDAIRKLTHFQFVRKISRDQEMANSSKFYEQDLVNYLNGNSNLGSLLIEDYTGMMLTASHPILKEAMMNHPHLTSFANSTLMLSREASLLVNNDELKAALARKKLLDPVAMKAKIAQDFEQFRRNCKIEILTINDNLNEEPIDWQNIQGTLTSASENLDRWVTQYERYSPAQVDDLSLKKSTISVMKDFVKLVLTVATIKTQDITGQHNNSIELLLDTTLPKLSEEIQKGLDENVHDFSETSKKIISQIQKLEPISQELASKSRAVKTTAPMVFPKSYDTVTNEFSYGLGKAVALLKDYTKNNSAMSRFFHGHWNRHHVAEVATIVARTHLLTLNPINSLDELKTALSAIKLANPNGSLSRRIKFIEQHCHEDSVTNSPYMDVKNF